MERIDNFSKNLDYNLCCTGSPAEYNKNRQSIDSVDTVTLHTYSDTHPSGAFYNKEFSDCNLSVKCLKVTQPSINYCVQAPGLAEPMPVMVNDTVTVYTWNEVQNAGLTENGNNDTLLVNRMNNETDKLLPVISSSDFVIIKSAENSSPMSLVQVESDLNGYPALKSQGPTLQVFTAAYLTCHMFESRLGRDIVFNEDKKGMLPIYLDYPKSDSPYFDMGETRQIVAPDPISASDPDTIAHEVGHAILDALFHYDLKNWQTASCHEAFADATALLLSLQSREVRKDILSRRLMGEATNLASVIGEGSKNLLPESIASRLSQRDGLRNLSWEEEEEYPESRLEDPHSASRRFSCAFYRSLLLIEKDQQLLHPNLSEEKALENAAMRLTDDFVHILDYLPKKPLITQSDLACALLKANRQNHKGDDVSSYLEAFQNSSLDLSLWDKDVFAA